MKTLPHLVLLLSLYACDTQAPLRAGRWDARTIRTPSSVTSAAKTYRLELRADGTAEMELDANTCIGTWTAEPESISLTCTYRCCDSVFAERLVRLINRSPAYVVDGSLLRVTLGDTIAEFRAVP
ncbi:MAG: META domain-containing protein [Bacteroidia bacterium]|nr:META domain-containing protein [Bacteroidia bacterium]